MWGAKTSMAAIAPTAMAHTAGTRASAAVPFTAGYSLTWATRDLTTAGTGATQWLLELFGHNAGYVAIAILAVTGIFTAWAFWQGRSIELGPFIKFHVKDAGKARDPADDIAEAPPGQDEPKHSPDSRLADVTRVFDVVDANQFYGDIAANYDQRNSVNLLATHLEVISRIDQARTVKPELRVLDLGGGTGQNVATWFFKDNKIHWTYVDSSAAMVDQLQQHLAGRPLYERLTVHVEDINRIHLRLRPMSHDVVLMSLVLSSMPQLPDFSRIGALLSPGGMLIISDINPLYTAAHPYYKATAGDGSQVAMRTKPVQPLELTRRASEAGLHLTDMTQIGSADLSYSFIAVFASAIRPSEGRGNRDGQILPKWVRRSVAGSHWQTYGRPNDIPGER
jgi:2-polyprenyl-3-methyl-5-hydroxy-6-metoxy-1,4-benzoquinol methylase